MQHWILLILFLLMGQSVSPSDQLFAEDSNKKSPQVDAKNQGFSYPLFNGNNLDGWKIENGCEVEVQEGMMLLKSGDGWIRTLNTYRDFQLHLEWKALKDSSYDAGIYLRTSVGGTPYPKQGYQVNLREGQEGNTLRLKGATSQGLIKKGDWNVFDITVEGKTVSMTINGTHAYTKSGLMLDDGFIGLQVEVPLGGQFLVRNIVVTELGYQSLFNGNDLSGWNKVGKQENQSWTVVAKELLCTGRKGSWIRSEKQYDDFNLRFDYKVSPGGNSGVYVRVPEDGKHHQKDDKKPLAGFEIQILDDAAEKYKKLKPTQFCCSVYAVSPARKHVGKKAGEWNRMEINCLKDQVTVIHNGIEVVKINAKSVPALSKRALRGYFGLQNHNTKVHFRNIRIGTARTIAMKEKPITSK